MAGIGIVAESLADVVVPADDETLADAGAEGEAESDSESEAEGDSEGEAESDSEGESVDAAVDEDSEPDDTAPEAEGDTDPEAEDADEIGPVAEAVTDALLDIEPVDVTVSEAGIDDGMLRDSLGEMVALDDTPVPNKVDDGVMPDERSVPESVKVGRGSEDADREMLSEELTVSVPVGRGAERLTEPDTVAEGTMPDDRRLDEKSDAMLEAMLLRSEVGIGRGIDAVGRREAVVSADSALDTKLDTTLGRAEPVGKSETADDRRLESSEITDGATDGRMPEADGDSVMVADTGAVGLANPELGLTPVGKASDTTEDKNEDRSSSELEEAPSEVGIAPDGEASLVRVADADADSVPSAVVIPMMIPVEPLEETSPVGTTPLLGRMPDSTAEVGVGSAVLRRVDRRDPTRPVEELGSTISEAGGNSPVEAPWDGWGRSDERRPLSRPADEVGTAVSEGVGNPPVEPTSSGL